MATLMQDSITSSPTTEEVISVPILKIHGSNYQVESDLSKYPDELKMLVVALHNSVLSKAMFDSFAVPMSWLSKAGSTASYNKKTGSVEFTMVNETRIRVSKRLFCKILGIPNIGPYVEVTSSQVVFMFNEMGHQPPLTCISDFKKSSLPTVWNFLFGIFLRCLTGRTVGLDKGRMEVYTIVAGLYYDLHVDYSEQLWTEFSTSISKTNVR